MNGLATRARSFWRGLRRPDRLAAEIAPTAVDHHAPARSADRNADAEIAEHRFGKNDAAEAEHQIDEHEVHDVR